MSGEFKGCKPLKFQAATAGLFFQLHPHSLFSSPLATNPIPDLAEQGHVLELGRHCERYFVWAAGDHETLK